MRRHLLSRSSVVGLVAAAFLAPAIAAAQGSASISGTVTDSASGRPIPSVQVVVVGTTRGAVSDEQGRFAVHGVSAGTWSVRAQRIGYRPETRSITLADGQSATADFTMAEVARMLSEVVSTGYGTDTRATVSTAVTTVSGAEVASVPVPGVDQALQGKAAGVQVTSNAGNPGNAITVRIRGAASLTASNQPLFVVDGIPLNNESVSQLDVGGQDINGVTGLNPDEIESITVLKDAAAAAIYGSRGSNGVVMVTTKRGRSGAGRINVDAYTGVQDVAKKWDLLTGPEYLTYRNEAWANDHPLDTAAYRHYGNPKTAINTDWQDAVFRTAPINNTSVGATGGTERIQYFVSGSYFDQTGVVLGSGYQRASGRVNLDFNATSKLAIKTSVNVSRESWTRFENDNTIEGVVTNAIADNPYLPVKRADGSYTGDELSYPNPVAIALLSNINSRSLRTLGNVEATYNLTPAWKLSGRAGADVGNLRDLRWESPNVEATYAASVSGVARQGNNTFDRYVLEGFTNYDVPWLVNHSQQLSLTAGSSLEWNGREYDYLRGEGFASEGFRYPGAATRVTVYDGGWTGNNLASFFGRANYSLYDRYLVTASVRTDGSSRFGANNRWGTFPAVSLGWKLTDEPWFNGMIGEGNSLKLRGSIGTTGNQALPQDFGSLERYARKSYGDVIGIGQVSLANPDLRWESTREYDGGFDLYLFNTRVALIGDYYSKLTSNLLVNRPISATTGQSTELSNVGNIKNAGVEAQLTTRNFTSDDPHGFTWTTDLNIAANRNKVVGLYNDEPFSAGSYSANRVQVGHPLGEFYMYRFLGVDPATGDAKYSDDLEFVGSPHPKYQGGFTSEMSWMGFDLHGFVQFNKGNQIFNAIRVFADDGGRYSDNKFADVLRRWQKPGDITDEPRASRAGRSDAVEVSSRYLEDGSYVRIGDVTLGYTLPSRWAGMTGLNNARLYVSGHNLHTFTKYKGYSPDVNSQGATSNIGLGTDFYAYPVARSFTFGVKAGF
jgi:TonB-linked SusC/RagA family outer membrane protein